MRYLSIIMAALLLSVASFAHANSIGASYGSSALESGWAVHGDIEKNVTKRVKVGAEGQLQGGDSYTGHANVAVTVDGPVDVRVESNNTAKGNDLLEMERTNDVGASLVFPIKDTEWSVGVFGKQGDNPLGPQYDHDNSVKVSTGTLKTSGLEIKSDSTLNLAVRGELEAMLLGRNFEIGLRGLFEVAGEGDRVHQLIADIQTGGNLLEGIDWNLQATVTGQLFGGDFQHEHAVMAGVVYRF